MAERRCQFPFDFALAFVSLHLIVVNYIPFLKKDMCLFQKRQRKKGKRQKYKKTTNLVHKLQPIEKRIQFSERAKNKLHKQNK